MGRPIGSAEQAVLVRLAERGGSWKEGDRPLWESNHWTLTLLNALTSKGLVTEVECNKQYGLNDLGRTKASEFAAQSRDISSDDWHVGWPSQRGSNRATEPNHHWR